jgi:hypothetical protein
MILRCWRIFGRALRLVVVTMLAGFVSGTAMAQGAGDPNTGALTFTGGVDVPSVYVFRGFVQERDPAMTLSPFGDLGLALHAGDGGLKSVGVNVGVWNSLQTGSSGTKGPSRRLHYREDFYATLTMGFGAGVDVAPSFTARTSPNGMLTTNREISVKVSKAGGLGPYGLIAFELDENGQADSGAKKGTYLEVGARPRWALGRSATVAVPIKVGLSGKDYYEGADGDEKFGFFDIGGHITIPLGGVPTRFGSWNIHGGADVLVFGDTTKAFNTGDKSQVVALFGIGVTY